MKRTYILILALSALVAFSACERVIDVDLNDADPTLVIEAKVSNRAEPQTVILTKTTSYFTPDTPAPVTNATVTVRDDQGEEHAYTEVTDGVYIANFMGQEGRTYTLEVISEGETYSGQSRLRPTVSLDSLTFARSGFSEPNAPPSYLTFTNFNDPAERGNYYRVREVSEDPAADAFIYLLDDISTNGNLITFPLFGNTYPVGTDITIELWHIDQSAYNYFTDLSELQNAGSPFSSTPANPDTNLSNGALGFFVAYSVSTLSGTITE